MLTNSYNSTTEGQGSTNKCLFETKNDNLQYSYCRGQTFANWLKTLPPETFASKNLSVDQTI